MPALAPRRRLLYYAYVHTPQRKRPAHRAPIERDGRPAIVFVTVCTAKRKPILATSASMQTIVQAWATAKSWRVGRFVIMPDHIHLFCAPANDGVSLRGWVRFWKSVASRRWPRPTDQPIWQLDFWDTQLRRTESYAAKWHYVRGNPVRHGLVSRPEEWPYAGEIDVLAWDV